MKNFLIRFLKGMAVGGSSLIPGISGSVVMVVINFYDTMIEAYDQLFKNFKKSFFTLLPFELGGSIVAPVLFSVPLVFLQENFPFQTNLFFAAVIAGSIPFIWNIAQKEQKFRWQHMIPFLLALGVVVTIAILQRPTALENAFVASTGTSPNGVLDYLFLILCGCLGSTCGVTPGISASFVMILVGAYPRVVGAWAGISNPDTMLASVLTLVPFFVGNFIGTISVSKVIAFLLKKFHSYCYAAILGLVCGSVFSILYSPKTYHTAEGLPITWSVWSILAAVLVTVAGFVLAFFLGKARLKRK